MVNTKSIKWTEYMKLKKCFKYGFKNIYIYVWKHFFTLFFFVVIYILILSLCLTYTFYLSRIEHLQPEDLKPLTSNIFGFIRPKIAIFSTPNQEFNVLFPQLSGFRHWDHKFEWTRSQFTEWYVTNFLFCPL